MGIVTTQHERPEPLSEPELNMLLDFDVGYTNVEGLLEAERLRGLRLHESVTK